MAGFRRRNRFPARPRVSRATQWTGDFTNVVTALPAATIGTLQLVVPGDYQDTATVEPGGVTLLRIRGWLNVTTALNNSPFWAGIYVSESTPFTGAGTDTDPGVFAGIINGDLVWWNMGMVHAAPEDPYRIEIDVKAKRKLESENVTFRILSGANALTYVMGARCLLSAV